MGYVFHALIKTLMSSGCSVSSALVSVPINGSGLEWPIDIGPTSFLYLNPINVEPSFRLLGGFEDYFPLIQISEPIVHRFETHLEKISNAYRRHNTTSFSFQNAKRTSQSADIIILLGDLVIVVFLVSVKKNWHLWCPHTSDQNLATKFVEEEEEVWGAWVSPMHCVQGSRIVLEFLNHLGNFSGFKVKSSFFRNCRWEILYSAQYGNWQELSALKCKILNLPAWFRLQYVLSAPTEDEDFRTQLLPDLLSLKGFTEWGSGIF